MISFLRELYIYPGRLENHDYKAYRLQNSFIEGSEYTPLLNNVIVRMIQESNPRELRIYPYISDLSIWGNLSSIREKYNRYIPQMRENEIVEDADDFVSLVKEIYTDIFSAISKHKLADRSSVYIINANYEFDEEQEKELRVMLSYIHTYGNANGFYVIYVGENIPEFIKEYTSLKISTIKKEERKDTDRSGTAKVISESSEVTVYIPFYPDTFLTKFMRYYSMNYKETKNES